MLKSKLMIGALMSLGAAAYADPTSTPRVDQREDNQAARINQGVESGELTKRETRTLDAREGKIARDEQAAKADGVVTAKERAQLHHEENRTSRAIHRKKHNDRTTTPAQQ